MANSNSIGQVQQGRQRPIPCPLLYGMVCNVIYVSSFIQFIHSCFSFIHLLIWPAKAKPGLAWLANLTTYVAHGTLLS